MSEICDECKDKVEEVWEHGDKYVCSDCLNDITNCEANMCMSCKKKRDELVQALSSLTQYLIATEDKPEDMKELQEAIKLIRQDQKVIYIDGYNISGGKKEGEGFENFKCIIGAWEGNDDDNDIFYYFDNEEHVKLMMETEKTRTDTEFVVTKVERVS